MDTIDDYQTLFDEYKTEIRRLKTNIARVYRYASDRAEAYGRRSPVVAAAYTELAVKLAVAEYGEIAEEVTVNVR